MHPVLRFNGQIYSTYALLAYLGIIVAAVYFFYAATRLEKFSFFSVVVFLFLVYFAQLAGGWILPGIYKWNLYGPFELRDLPRKGRYFHSVLLSCLAFVIVFTKVAKWPLKRTLDQFAIAVCIASAIGRIGCFLHGCCAGKASNLPWAVTFPRKEIAAHPTQLYHLIFEGFILLPFLFYIQKHRRFEGQTFWTYVFVYSVFRFFIEFFRTNPAAWLGLTHAQLFSFVIIIFGGWILKRNSNLAHDVPYKVKA